MRTSGPQFEMMVTFMEQHGDLNKPTGNARGRIEAITRWEELTSLLNSDASGEKKDTEKWKKVWSDLKNNTKKKVARLNTAANPSGGGPAPKTFSTPTAKLSDLENRVLQIIGHLAATGVGVSEGGFPKDQPSDSDSSPPIPVAEVVICTREEWRESLDHSYIASPASPTPTQTAPEPSTSGQVISSQHPQSPQNTLRRHRHLPPGNSPRRRHVHAQTPQNTPRRYCHLTLRNSPRHISPRLRTRPMTQTDRVAYEFQQPDSEWRKYLMDKEKREAENQAEQLRLRAIELRLQEQWQDIVKKALEILEKKL